MFESVKEFSSVFKSFRVFEIFRYFFRIFESYHILFNESTRLMSMALFSPEKGVIKGDDRGTTALFPVRAFFSLNWFRKMKIFVS